MSFLLTCDIAYDFSATQIQNLSHPDFERLAATVSELEARALEQLERDRIRGDRVTLVRHAECRYAGQGYELRAAAPGGAVDAGFAEALKSSFHAAHQREYGRHFTEKEVELVNLRVVGVGAHWQSAIALPMPLELVDQDAFDVGVLVVGPPHPPPVAEGIDERLLYQVVGQMPVAAQQIRGAM